MYHTVMYTVGDARKWGGFEFTKDPKDVRKATMAWTDVEPGGRNAAGMRDPGM
jgi:hypothetical protein